MKLTDEERAMLTPDEAKLLEGEQADTLLEQGSDGAAAAGADEEGAEAEEQAAAEGEGAQAKPAEKDDLEAIVAEAEQRPDQAPQPEAKQYAIPEGDHDAKLADLKTRQQTLSKSWADGTTDDEAYSTQMQALQDERDAIVRAQATADALKQINEQHARDAEQKREAELNTAVVALIEKSKAQGSPINYNTDTDAQAEFDRFFDALLGMPKHANKPAAEIAALAHKSVLTVRGIPVAAPAAASATAAAPAAPKPVGPMTLSGIPDAGKIGLQDELTEQIHSMDAEELESWMATQPQHVIDRVMKSADRAH